MPKSKKNQVPKMQKKHIAIMLVFTSGYLVSELAFSARLLDVMGSGVSRGEIDSIEKVGRILTGIAVFLLIFGAFIFPRLNKSGIDLFLVMLVFIITAPIVIFPAYVGQKALVDWLVGKNGPEKRKQAVQLQLVQSSVLSGQAKLTGMELTRGTLGTPEGKSFIALLPLYGSRLSRTDILDEEIINTLLREAIRSELGTRNEFLKNRVYPGIKRLQRIYNEKYVEASNEYFSRLSPENVDREAEEAWSEYLGELENRNTTPTDLPERYWPRVRRELRQKGVMVPDSWKPYDKMGFIKSMKENYQDLSRKEFRRGVKREVGSGLEPGLSWEEFLNSSAVRAYLKSKSRSIKKYGVPERITKQGLLQQYYEPLFRDQMNRHKAIFTANSAAFGPDGKFEEQGKEAMYLVIAPAMALILSMLAALTHIIKTGNYFLQLSSVPGKISWPLMLCLVVGLVALAKMHDYQNRIIETQSFESLHQNAIQNSNPYLSALARGGKYIIEFQPYFYPVNKELETRLRLEDLIQKRPL